MGRCDRGQEVSTDGLRCACATSKYNVTKLRVVCVRGLFAGAPSDSDHRKASALRTSFTAFAGKRIAGTPDVPLSSGVLYHGSLQGKDVDAAQCTPPARLCARSVSVHTFATDPGARPPRVGKSECGANSKCRAYVHAAAGPTEHQHAGHCELWSKIDGTSFA